MVQKERGKNEIQEKNQKDNSKIKSGPIIKHIEDMKCKVRLVNLSSKHALTASETANRANNLENKRQEAEEALR